MYYRHDGPPWVSCFKKTSIFLCHLLINPILGVANFVFFFYNFHNSSYLALEFSKTEKSKYINMSTYQMITNIFARTFHNDFKAQFKKGVLKRLNFLQHVAFQFLSFPPKK